MNSDVTENVTVPKSESYNPTKLDLNGHTLSGGTAAGKATITVKGDLQITNGTVTRDDNGADGYYVIDNQGTVALKAGAVVKNNAASASVICNGTDEATTLSIYDGATVSSEGESIAVKNDDHGCLFMYGGTVTSASKTNAAILNWNTTTISSGTISAPEAFAAFETKTNANSGQYVNATITGGTVEGKVLSMRDYGSATSGIAASVNAPKILITGGSFTGEVVAQDGTAVKNDNEFLKIKGGTFSVDVKNYVEAGYTCVKTENGYAVEQMNEDNAKVEAGEAYYDSLTKAFEGAPSGTTVKLLKDIDIDTIASVPAGKELTLDLNGHVMKSTASVAFNNAATSELVILDSSENGTGSVEAAAIANISGNLTVNGGTFKDITNYGIMANSGATVAINGGTFDAVKANSKYAILYANKGAIVVDDAVVTNATEGSYVLRTGTMGGTLTVNDGKFKGALKEGQTGTLTIGGGYFTADPEAFVAEGLGYFNVAEADYPYAVNAAAFVDGFAYMSLVDAVAHGGQVVLQRDCDENIVVPEGTKIELVLNGCTLNGGSADGRAAIINKGELTITNGTVARDDNGAKGYYVIDNEGVLTLGEGAVVENNAATASVLCNGHTADATLNVQEGATISSKGASIALKNDDHGTLNVAGGTVKTTSADHAAIQNWNKATISGGTVSAAEGHTAIQTAADKGTSAGNTEITGGAINGTVMAQRVTAEADVADPQVAISGGDFTGDVRAYNGTNFVSKYITITGGTFSQDVYAFVADVYACVKGNDDRYAVSPCTAEVAAAKIGDTYYQTVARAAACAEDNATIELVQDCTETAIVSVSEGQHLTVDLAGHALTSKATSAFNNAKNSSLTIADNSESKTGAVSARSVANINGELVINGGTFKDITSNGILVPNTASEASVVINDGTFIGKTGSTTSLVYMMKGSCVINDGAFANEGSGYAVQTKAGTLTINDGQFKGKLKASPATNLTIGGGMFSVDPSAFVAEGKSAQFISEDGYTAKVVSVEELQTVEPEVAMAPAQVEVAETIAPEAKDAATEVAKAMSSEKADAPVLKVSDEAMENAAKAEALPVDQAIVVNGQVTSPLAELQKVEGLSEVTVEDVAVVRQAFLQATVNDVEVEGGAVKAFTVDIKPMVKTFVTTKENVGNIEEGTNAIVLGEVQQVNIVEPTTVTIPLVDQFTAEPESTLFVKHNHEGKIFFYHAAVQDNDGVRTASFNNPNGFSEFTISSTNPAVVETGEGENAVGYESLEDAVANVEDGGIINVLDSAAVSGSKIVLSEAKSFSLIDSEGNPFTDIVIAAGKGFIVDDSEEGTYTVIAKTSLKDAEIVLATDSVIYCGQAWKPEFTVEIGGKTLEEGVDYRVSYNDNVDAGFGEVVVSGIGAYFDTASKEFEITKGKQDIEGLENISKTYGDADFIIPARAKGELAFASDNTNVVKVSDQGVASIVGAGIATIKVDAAEADNYNAASQQTIVVTVAKASQSVKVAKTSYSLVNGAKAFDLGLKGSESGYQCTTSNAKVATVSAAGKVSVKGVGKATLKVRAKENANYKASAYKSVTVKVSPKGTKLSKTKAAKKSFKASWKKAAKANASGYQVRCSASSKMSSAKKVTVKGNSKTSVTVKNLKAKKKYYVQVRTYKKSGSKTYYSDWSAKKAVTTKK